MIHNSSEAVTKDYIQYASDQAGCPLLPPDRQQCVQQGPKSVEHHESIDRARRAYNIGMGMNSNKNNQRKYLRGGLYMNLFFEQTNHLDVRDFGGRLNMYVKLGDGMYSFMMIRDLSHERDAMTVIKNFNENCSKASCARDKSDDLGSMFAFGKRNKLDDYKSMRESDESLTKYAKVGRKLLGKYFGPEVDAIISADTNQGVSPTEMMGGRDGLSAYFLVSKDLINAAHYDLDTSVSMTIFNEKMIGKAEDWYFVLPNTFEVNDRRKRSIIIKLFDGCAICWDGRKIFHATATKEIHKKRGNHTYGNFWGGKKYNDK